jgi:hypothetical protein
VRACAARGKAIGLSVCGHKNLGTWATRKHNESIELVKKLASVCFKSRDTIHERRIPKVDTTKSYYIAYVELELIEHIPSVPWYIASATDGFNPGEIRSIEDTQDSLVQACAVVSIGVATMGNKRDCLPYPFFGATLLGLQKPCWRNH